jgi:hypothetical protein
VAKVYCFERGKLLKRMRKLVEDYERTRLAYHEKSYINYYDLQWLLFLEKQIIDLDAILNGEKDPEPPPES